MALIKEIKELSKKYNKKIGRESIILIEAQIRNEIESIIKSAARNSDFMGRKLIKKEDIVILEK